MFSASAKSPISQSTAGLQAGQTPVPEISQSHNSPALSRTIQVRPQDPKFLPSTFTFEQWSLSSKPQGQCTSALGELSPMHPNPNISSSPLRLYYQAEGTQTFGIPLKIWQKFLPMSCSLVKIHLFPYWYGLEKKSLWTELCFTPAPSGRGESIGNEILDLESISLWRGAERSLVTGLVSTARFYLTS